MMSGLSIESKASFTSALRNGSTSTEFSGQSTKSTFESSARDFLVKDK